jgi:hypothetical protein
MPRLRAKKRRPRTEREVQGVGRKRPDKCPGCELRELGQRLLGGKAERLKEQTSNRTQREDRAVGYKVMGLGF